MSGHTDDFGGAQCVKAVVDGDAYVALDGLTVRVPCRDVLAEDFQAAHLRLDPALAAASCPAFPDCPTVVPGGAHGFISRDSAQKLDPGAVVQQAQGANGAQVGDLTRQ